MSEWVETTLGACFDHVRTSADPTALAPGTAYVGMEHFASDTRWIRGAGTIDAVKSRVGIFEEGDVLYGKLRAYLRKVALASGSGAASTEVLILRARQHVYPRFLYLLASSPQCTAHAVAKSAGSRMPRTSVADLGEFRVNLPSKDQQARIVDLMTSVEVTIEALAREVSAARAVLDRLNADSLARLPETRMLGEFTTTRSGPSYGADDVSPQASSQSVPAIGIPNTKPDGSLDLSSVSHVVGLPATVGRIDEASLVLIRTNGNRQRIGNVYMPGEDAHGHIVSAFQFLMRVSDPALREYTYWVLREPSMQAAMSESASGTTGLGNMAVKWLNSARVHWSEDANERESAIAPLRAQTKVVQSLTAELARLRMFRSTLLTALLNQEIEIPESYDSLLEEAHV